MSRLKSVLVPSGKRSLSATGERVVLLGIIALLFVLDYRFGVLHRTIAMLESADTTLGSALMALFVASWAGVFSYAFRRRLELNQAMVAKAEAEQNAETAEICDRLTGLPNRVGLKAALRARLAVPASAASSPSTSSASNP